MVVIKLEKERIEELKEKYKKICIALPTYKIVPAATILSFYTTLSFLYKHGFEPDLVMLDQTSIAIARNALSEYIYNEDKKKEYDLIWWLDSDHTFTFAELIALIDRYDKHEEIKILSAKYVTRDQVHPKVCGFNLTKEGKYRNVSPEVSGIVEVDAIGYGFLIMDGSVMRDMFEKYKKHQYVFVPKGDPEDGGMIGEDMYWCSLAQKEGYKIYLDADVAIGHYGGVIDERFLKVVGEPFRRKALGLR